MRWLIVALMNSRLYAWFMREVIWRIRFSNWYSKINGRQYMVGYTLLRPGDIVLTTDRSKLTSYLIKGEWTHAAICIGRWLGRGEQYEIAEMTHLGFTKSMFYDLCKECDRFVILRVKTWDKGYINNVIIPNVYDMEDAGYDIQFEFGVKALYCSELIYEADADWRCRVDVSDFAGLGRQYVSPLAYYESPDVEVVFDSKDLK